MKIKAGATIHGVWGLYDRVSDRRLALADPESRVAEASMTEIARRCNLHGDLITALADLRGLDALLARAREGGAA